jgi:hypothetical protein
VTDVQAQVETVSQQTPVHGVTQVPAQVKAFGAAHAAGATTLQTPVALLQHLPTQGLGVQTLLAPWKAVPAKHPLAATAMVVQAQEEVVSQQTPGQTAPHVPAQVKTLGAAQLVEVVTVHAPLMLEQHLPVQGLGVHVLAAPWKVVPVGQPVAARVIALQAQEVVSQQTPAQTVPHVPPQVKMLGLTQLAGATMVQAPVAELQHLPVQGLGEQTLEAPWKVVPVAQPVAGTVIAAQEQEVVSQQTPGQTAAQVPAHVKTLGAGQLVEMLTVHAPLLLEQHLPVQGLGEQVLDAPWNVVPVAQPVAAVVIEVQAQVLVEQHTPGQTAAHVPAHVKTFGEAQLVEVVTVHAPLVLEQHLPVQGLGLQVLDAPWNVVPAAQPVAAVVIEVQAQVLVEQQTPGQTAAHVPPQVKTLGEVQLAGGTTVQAPLVLLQHLPVQGLGVQVLAAPWNVVPVAQPVAAVAMAAHAQEVESQQTPGQTAVHVPPQVNTLGATQLAGGTTVHAPLLLAQHLPVHGLGVQVAPEMNVLGGAHAVEDATVVQLHEVSQHAPPVPPPPVPTVIVSGVTVMLPVAMFVF